MGLSGRVPRRVDAATKSGLLELIDDALEAGWPLRRACRELDVGEGRAWRWLARRERDELDDKTPGGNPSHGLLAAEVAVIVALFHDWGETDRSHRKLAHRGSYLNRVWVSPSTVRRVLAGQGLRLKPPPRPGRSQRRPFPDWVDYRPGQIWIYDTTHFTRAGMAVTVVEDLVSRKWLAHIVSAEETSTQIEIVSTDALAAEGLLAGVEARADGLVPIDVDDDARPILLAVSDNGPQMTSGSTREFMALCAIAQHFGRPATPTDQAWIESLFGHLKVEQPHLLAIDEPGVLRAELAIRQAHYNSVRLSLGAARRSARPARQASSRPETAGLPGTANTAKMTPPTDPAMLASQTPNRVVESDTRQLTDFGLKAALFLTRAHARLIRAGLAEVLDTGVPAPRALRRAFDRVETVMDDIAQHARIAA